MANNPFGATFAPTTENAQSRSGGGGGTYEAPVQVLNFRLPQVTGAATANAISPLVGEARRPTFGSAVLESVFRTILGPEQASEFLGASPASASMFDQGAGSDNGFAVLQALSQGQSGGAPSGGQAPSASFPPHPPGPIFTPADKPGEERPFVPIQEAPPPQEAPSNALADARTGKFGYDAARAELPSWWTAQHGAGSY
jgi:hypothetical protein